MKKLLLALAALSSVAMADNKFFGLGAAADISKPPAFSLHGRIWVMNPNAVDISAAWSDKNFSLMGEYKWFQYKDIQIQNGQLPWYYGVGGFLNMSGGLSGIGVRPSVGLSWEPSGVNMDAFGETFASVSTSSSTPDFGVRLGLHFYMM